MRREITPRIDPLAGDPCPVCGGDGWRMIGDFYGRHHYEPCLCEMGREREAEHAHDAPGHAEPFRFCDRTGEPCEWPIEEVCPCEEAGNGS